MPAKRGNVTNNLINTIRRLIKGYSSDTILKEYLQNADDAGATELIVTYDKQRYQSLIDTEYKISCGPALLLSNNAKFETRDFDSIVDIGAQNKVKDSNSTGRFGLGFNSSYSISDHPSFISSDRIYWFDILQESVCKGSPDNYLMWEEEDFHEIKSWLDTFKVSGLNNFKSYNGTIFRLPLRTEKTALTSQISNEIFSFDKFLKWCDEWKDKAKDLIFLRNINRLVLQEINEDGEVILHLELKTENINEIDKTKKKINSYFSKDALDTCQNWLESDTPLPIEKYYHKFSIAMFSRETNKLVEWKENWKVVNGLFRGPNDILLNQAKKALSIHPEARNVLPWAGVAIELDENDLPIYQEGQWYTFLSLFSSQHPILLHGWFDLEDDRRKLTYDGTSDDIEVLKQWNEQLLEHGVGVAWALLVNSIKDKNNLDNYYKFWAKEANDTNIDSDLESCLIKGFYQKISELDCLYVVYQGHGTWMYPSDHIYSFEEKKHPSLLKAFQEHFQIISRKPKKYIVENFKQIDIGLDEITPKFLREFLQKTAEVRSFPISMENVTIKMLANKAWLIDILNYCTGQEDNYELLNGLPLELTMGGSLNIIGQNEVVFDKEFDFELMQNKKDLCVDFDILDSIESDLLPSSWLEYSLKNVVNLLLTHWNEFELTIEWVELLVQFIYKHREHIEDNLTQLNQLEIVYQENEEWKTLKSDIINSSPVLIEKEEINNIDLLKSIGINVIHPNYLSLYKQLAKEGLITKFSAATLIAHIMLEEDYTFFEDQATREYIVDILSNDFSWYNDLSDEGKKAFSSIPFIYTVSGKLCSLSDTDLYISTTFKPPKKIKGLSNVYELIDLENDHQTGFYKKIGIQEQTAKIYLVDTIIPFLEKTKNENDCVSVLSWLVSNWESLSEDFKGEEQNEVITLLRNSRIIPDQQAIFFRQKASKLYHPSFDLPECLQDNKRYQAIIFSEPNLQWKWEHFLAELNASYQIFSDHVVSKVIYISQRQNENVQKDAICLANYILINMQNFESMRYSNGMILDELKKHAWLPVEDPSKYLLNPSRTYSMFMSPQNLVRSRDAKIVGGVYFVLNSEINFKIKNNESGYEPRDMAKKLGLLVALPIDDIYESFRQLIHLNTSTVDEKIIIQYALEFYKYLGRQHKLERREIPHDIRQNAIRINSLWISADRVFKRDSKLDNIYFWGSISQDIRGEYTDLNLKNGLELLGIREKPDILMFVDLLKELPAEKILSKNELTQAKLLLDEIQDAEDIEIEEYVPLPLLSTEELLIDSEDLFIRDLPAYNKAENKNEEIKFCKPTYRDLAKRLNVESLKERDEPRLNTDETIFGNNEILNIDIVDFMEMDHFKEAILRLLYDEKKISEDRINYDSLLTALPKEIKIVEKLVIDHYAYHFFLYTDYEATTHDEKSNSTLYILAQEDPDDMIDAISKYICEAKKLSKDSLLYIQRILRRKMNRDAINTYLDKESIKELPEKIDFEKESIYYENEEFLENENYPNEESASSNDHDKERETDDIVDDNSKDEETEASSPLITGLNQTPDVGDIGNAEASPKEDNEDTPEYSQGKTNVVADSTNVNDTKNEPAEEPTEVGGDGHTVPAPTTPQEAEDKDFIPSDAGAASGSSSGNSTGGNYNSNYPSNTSFPRSRSSNTNIVSSNDFKPVYIGQDREADREKSKEERERAKRDGDKGEEYILSNSSDYLLSKDNYFEETPPNNPGFDILEKDFQGNIVRYIEVKALTGRWGTLGAGITKVQLEFALQYGAKWWLIVIEGLNTDNKEVWQFKNPVSEATKFMFDHSWKQLAYIPFTIEKPTENNTLPTIGDTYLIPVNGNKQKFEITKIKEGGKLIYIWVKKENESKTVRMKFNQNWEKA